MGKAKPKSPSRRYCTECGKSGYVPGPPVIRDGMTYATVADCPKCRPKPPPIPKTEPKTLSLDRQSRAAGENAN